MAKIHPFPATAESSSAASCSPSTNYGSDKAEIFTVWMKSLVMQANGCTIYNENGQIVYRVDNYDKKGSNDVYLMDLKGRVLFTIIRTRKMGVFRQWRGYKSDIGPKSRTQKPFFQAGKSSGVLEISVQSGENAQDQYSRYKLEVLNAKSTAFKITNINGELVAEAKRKQLSSGVVLGDDVLTLAVEARVDHSFVMAVVTIYGLMQHRL